MKLTKQLISIPIKYDESPKKDGDEITINDNITFGKAINFIESYCKNLEYFHRYTVHIIKKTWKHPIKMVFNIYIQDPNRTYEDVPEDKVVIVGHENEFAPNLICMFTLYNNDEHPFWSGYGEFTVSNIDNYDTSNL